MGRPLHSHHSDREEFQRDDRQTSSWRTGDGHRDSRCKRQGAPSTGRHHGRRPSTLKLLSEIDDSQLRTKIPGAPWSDGTVGGIIAVHTHHWAMHAKWALEGTRD